MNSRSKEIRIIRRKEVESITGLSRATIYDRLNPKSVRFDVAFPRPIKLGASAVGWIAEEIDQYLQHLIMQSRKET